MTHRNQKRKQATENAVWTCHRTAKQPALASSSSGRLVCPLCGLRLAPAWLLRWFRFPPDFQKTFLKYNARTQQICDLVILVSLNLSWNFGKFKTEVFYRQFNAAKMIAYLLVLKNGANDSQTQKKLECCDNIMQTTLQRDKMPNNEY